MRKRVVDPESLIKHVVPATATEVLRMPTRRAKNAVSGDAIKSTSVRQGWAHDSQKIAEDGDDNLAWPEFGHQSDEVLKW